MCYYHSASVYTTLDYRRSRVIFTRSCRFFYTPEMMVKPSITQLIVHLFDQYVDKF